VHYPNPIYLQPALRNLNLKVGDFPVTDWHAKNIISFPCDQHLSLEEMNFVIRTVENFYKNHG
jgi:dTDP-4-amino-4,6-dideoxygalactose transaminase